jgi:hypothetical protein
MLITDIASPSIEAIRFRLFAPYVAKSSRWCNDGVGEAGCIVVRRNRPDYRPRPPAATFRAPLIRPPHRLKLPSQRLGEHRRRDRQIAPAQVAEHEVPRGTSRPSMSRAMTPSLLPAGSVPILI